MSDLSSMIELTDSDVLTIEKVAKVINEKQGIHTDMDGFRREIIDRFHSAGFVTDVLCYSTDQPGLYAFDVVIKDRVEGEFDPDQQVYEATHDILGLDGVNGGVIKSAPIIAQQAHSHGKSARSEAASKVWTPGSN